MRALVFALQKYLSNLSEQDHRESNVEPAPCLASRTSNPPPSQSLAPSYLQGTVRLGSPTAQRANCTCDLECSALAAQSPEPHPPPNHLNICASPAMQIQVSRLMIPTFSGRVNRTSQSAAVASKCFQMTRSIRGWVFPCTPVANIRVPRA
jgi:hypothetical protein